jgi:hypothetical protein
MKGQTTLLSLVQMTGGGADQVLTRVRSAFRHRSITTRRHQIFDGVTGRYGFMKDAKRNRQRTAKAKLRTRKRGSGNDRRISIGRYVRLLLPFLNRYILILPIKSLAKCHIQKAIAHHNETNDEIFDIDMNVWDIARNGIKPISFHLFR